MLPLLVYVERRGQSLAEAEPGEVEKGLTGLLLLFEEPLLSVLFHKRKPGFRDLGGQCHGDGFQILTGGLHVQDGTPLERGDPLPEVHLVGRADGQRDSFRRDRERAEPAASREVRSGPAVPCLDADLRPLPGGRLAGQSRCLFHPGPCLSEVEVVRKGLLDKCIEGGIPERDPPPLLIGLRRA